MLRAEIWMAWLSYNLARLVGAQAALAHNCEPREISFTALKANLASFAPRLATAQGKEWHLLVRQMWRGVTTIKVGNRADRSEPREVKRRPPRKYPPLRKPRQQARAELRQESEQNKARAEPAQAEEPSKAGKGQTSKKSKAKGSAK